MPSAPAPAGRRFDELTDPEIAAALARSPRVILPMGSVEQHGPHLPTGTDFVRRHRDRPRGGGAPRRAGAAAMPAGRDAHAHALPGHRVAAARHAPGRGHRHRLVAGRARRPGVRDPELARGEHPHPGPGGRAAAPGDRPGRGRGPGLLRGRGAVRAAGRGADPRREDRDLVGAVLPPRPRPPGPGRGQRGPAARRAGRPAAPRPLVPAGAHRRQDHVPDRLVRRSRGGDARTRRRFSLRKSGRKSRRAWTVCCRRSPRSSQECSQGGSA